jgi:hypothetical protein
MKKLEDRISSLNTRIRVMADLQHLILQELGDNNREFQAKVVACLLSKEEILNDFTDFIFNTDNVSDDIKLQVQEINEMIKEFKEEN